MSVDEKDSIIKFLDKCVVYANNSIERKRERGERKERGGSGWHHHAGHVPSYSESHFMVCHSRSSRLTRSYRLLPAAQSELSGHGRSCWL